MCACMSSGLNVRDVFFCALPPLSLFSQVRAAQHLLSEKGSILDIPREMSACMADGRYMDLVKLYRKAHTTYSSSILSKVRLLPLMLLLLYV